jgi:hypothetical protein
MRPLPKSRLVIASSLCFAAIASAQQTKGTAAVTVVPRLVRFAGSFHVPANQPAGPVGATFAVRIVPLTFDCIGVVLGSAVY